MPESCLVIACGALAREIQHLKTVNDWQHLEIQCLDAALHNTPSKIPARLAEKILQAGNRYAKILIAYGDCGTQGAIDRLIQDADHIDRLSGPHCFAAFAGLDHFETAMAAHPGTFWLTDFLTRHFETMVVKSLGLDKHPALLPTYFGHYSRLCYLSQSADVELLQKARAAANFLGLAFEHKPVGYSGLAEPLTWCAA